ncbi:hypothetical protein J3U22_02200 [Gilliamella sp. B2865]|uniref:hypothetical protein n=2 Tax=unclassified Gilliamella TaxID=2685620 RepID=UPI0022698E52|nr:MULTISPECIES: hypothetical protein [unclassified Gilliamella]MCX8669684.1 hypothetical protein [Gilliamella sp. B2785]MCX8678409.1 hypothetical protein [Gilliamella sp. B2865]
MNVMKKIQLPILIVCGVMLCSCSDEPKSVVRMIDNPTDNEIVVAIDGKELAIPANSNTTYTFEYGKHNLAYNNESLDFIVKPARFPNDGFINPTQSNYMFHTYIYATENTSDEDYDKLYEKSLRKVSIIINGVEEEVELPVKVINDVFIEREDNTWDYSINQEAPNELPKKFKTKKDIQLPRIKVYREKDYITLLKNEFFESNEDPETGFEVSFPNKPVKFAEIEQYVFPKINLGGIECDAGKKYLADTLDNWKQLFTLNGDDFASKYKKLGGEEGINSLRKSDELCPKEIDPNMTYYQAYGPFEKFLNFTQDTNIYIIK